MEEVEVLLLLAGEAGALPFDEIRRRLRVESADSLRASLGRLVASELLDCNAETGEYAYAPRDARTRNAVALLGAAYNERPVTLVRLIYSRPSMAQTFADAFRLKKDEEP